MVAVARTRNYFILASFLCLPVIASCDDEATSPYVPSALEVTAEATEPVQGDEAVEFSVRVVDASGNGIRDREVEWEALDARGSFEGAGTTSVLAASRADGETVTTTTYTDSDGVARARWVSDGRAGEVNVVARTEGLPDAHMSVEIVPGPLARIVASPSRFDFTALDQTDTLRVLGQDGYGNEVPAEITWASGDPAIVRVTEAGLVQARSVGDAGVVLTSGEFETIVPVSVTQEVAELTVSPGSHTLEALDEEVALTVRATDAGGSPIPVDSGAVAWSVEDGGVLAITEDGTAVAVGPGRSMVTATFDSVTATATISVTPMAAEVRLSREMVDLTYLGDEVVVRAEALDANENLVSEVPGTFTWRSGDPDIATVTPDGRITAVAVGSVPVTISRGEASAEVQVHVTQVTDSVHVAPAEAILVAMSDTVTLTATAFDQGGSDIPLEAGDFEWVSSDAAVLIVDAAGTVGASGLGVAQITATYADVSASATVTVDQTPTSIALAPDSIQFTALGEAEQVTAVARDAGGAVVPTDPQDFTWQMSDASVATVSAAGELEAVGPGTAVLTITLDSATVDLRVRVTQVTDVVELDRSSAAFTALGDTTALTATARDAGGSLIPLDADDFTWTSSDASVVSVNAAGFLTATGVGDADVTAMHAGVSASADISVEQTPTSITLAPIEVDFTAIGDSVVIAGVARDAGGSTIPTDPEDFTWESSDASVVTVSVRGEVRGVGTGNATLTATLGSASADIPVSVTQVTAEVELSPSAVTFTELGATTTIAATARDVGGTIIPLDAADFTWISADPSVLSVGPTGAITALGVGGAEVTATHAGVSDTTAVVVSQVPVSIDLSPAAVELAAIGESAPVSAVVRDGGGTAIPGDPEDLDWAISDASVATVNGVGTVTAAGPGSATLTVSIGDVSADIPVTVTQTTDEVELGPASVSFTALGRSADLTATARDPGGSVIALDADDFTWGSSDPAVATVDGSGTVTAVGVGTATITAAHSGEEDSSGIVVTQVVDEITVAPATLSLEYLGATADLTAAAVDAEGHSIPLDDDAFAWASTEESVVVVNGEGAVTAVSRGNASVTATHSGVTGTADVAVSQEPDSITTGVDAVAFAAIDSAVVVTAQIFDAGGTAIPSAAEDYTWETSDVEVATVTPAGQITSTGPGTATISVSFGGLSTQVQVEVDQVTVSVAIDPETVTIESPGETQQFEATALDSRGHAIAAATGQFTWSSSDGSVLEVDASGLATGIAAGEAQLTARFDGVEGHANVDVQEPTPDYLSVGASPSVTSVGTRIGFSAVVRAANGDAVPGEYPVSCSVIYTGNYFTSEPVSADYTFDPASAMTNASGELPFGDIAITVDAVPDVTVLTFRCILTDDGGVNGTASVIVEP